VSARTGRWRRDLAPLVLLATLVPGCGYAWVKSDGPATRLPAGQLLVAARLGSEENRAVAESAADILAGALRESSDVVTVRELLHAATVDGLGWAPRVVERLQRGGWPAAEERRVLQERLGIRTLVAVDVVAYEQVWGKYAKFTRAAVEAQALDLASGEVQWKLRGEAEIEDMRGRAFQYVLEQAVRELADAIHPRWKFSVTDAWRYWRR
jgi:hypothetical protein